MRVRHIRYVITLKFSQLILINQNTARLLTDIIRKRGIMIVKGTKGKPKLLMGGYE